MTADLVPPGARLADIGTDHACLPAALLLEGKIPRAVAADIRPGPLERARETARRWHLEERMSFRLCSGFEGIHREETDAAVLAGMGGETMAEILRAAPWTKQRPFVLVLQPMSSLPELRQMLQESGYEIRREVLCREGETLYTAWLVQGGAMPPLTPAELCAGKNSGDPLRGEWLDLWLRRTERALAGLVQARRPDAAARADWMNRVRTGLLEMKKEWETGCGQQRISTGQ